MVDIYLFSTLLKAIDFKRTKLLLIGDDAQIPSVSAGNVLYDLLNWNTISTVKLEKIFRYGSGGILTVATDIRQGEKYLEKHNEPQIFGDDKSYAFFPISQDRIIKYCVLTYKKLLNDGVKPEEILVLSAYNVGDYGTVRVNKVLQDVVNPNPEKKITFGESEYRLNDMVMCIQNDYKAIRFNEEWINEENVAFIANGESGKVVDITYNAMVVKYEDEVIFYTKSDLKLLRLAYCYSIHKSQGGNSRSTIILTPKAHTYTLNSNLLYVAVTRTVEKCYHIGEMNTINTAIKKKENFDRKTNLPLFLEEKGE
jgi:ATP-dependent exoDNAse (exonuclease V) alpha subunit